MSLDTQALPVPVDSTEDARFWLETTDFADLASIERQTAWKALKRCHTGSTWHKTALRVRLVDSVGGNKGQAYQVFAPSLPVELANAWAAKHPALFKKTEVPKTQDIPFGIASAKLKICFAFKVGWMNTQPIGRKKHANTPKFRLACLSQGSPWMHWRQSVYSI